MWVACWWAGQSSAQPGKQQPSETRGGGEGTKHLSIGLKGHQQMWDIGMLPHHCHCAALCSVAQWFLNPRRCFHHESSTFCFKLEMTALTWWSGPWTRPHADCCRNSIEMPKNCEKCYNEGYKNILTLFNLLQNITKKFSIRLHDTF